MDIDLILDNIYQLLEASKKLITQSITEVSFKKGHILLNADKVEKNTYFIKKRDSSSFFPYRQ